MSYHDMHNQSGAIPRVCRVVERQLKTKLTKRIAETHYVRSAIRDKADLSAFKKKPSFS